ncbi:hypothetical protein N7516_008200 [Penicillium verrucosum]|uniref:uncharacterized protein n=1 Tax=Penicillium verrucosum TaxID=60171 RepID=UPI002544E5E1|nr:uncharacterized protein N7516_008200 [Penicillium verrucosum]KAJ5926427.1 hypothetical protein N7516_008200 [Penicillium verrucosum]
MPSYKVVKKRATTRQRMMNAILDLQDQAHKPSLSQLKTSIASLTSTIQADQPELPTIAISSLNLGDVQVMLKLNHSLSNLEFRNKAVPDLCIDSLLTPAEKHWATELEVSCIVWVVRKIHHMIEAAPEHLTTYLCSPITMSPRNLPAFLRT